MNSPIKSVIIGALSLLSAISHAQDLIVTGANDSINCKITAISDDQISLTVRRDNRTIKTHYDREKISDFVFGYYVKNSFLKNVPDTTTYYVIETRDRNIFTGLIIGKTKTAVILRTETIGDVTLRLTEIEKAYTADGSVDSRWFDYLQSSRYFYGPTGFGLKKGDAYYQNVMVFFNQFALGITDNFSAGLGVIPLFLFAGAPTPVWVTPKFSAPIVPDKVHLGAGVLAGTVLDPYNYTDDNFNFGVAFGIATFGNRDQNLSIGLGYGYSDGDLNSRPTLSLSGMIKTGQKGYIITENYLFDEAGLLSVGGRSLIKSVTLDFGLIMPTGQGNFFAIPWLGFVIPIETKLKDQ